MTTHNVLAVALAVQVGLAAVTWWPRDAGSVEAHALVEGGANSITALEIVGSGDEAEPVRLEAVDGAWVIASADGYPADAEKVGEVLEALGTIKLRAPIATRATSHESLGVTDEGFEKKVTFTIGDETRSVLIGAAASKAVHLREAGADEVYVVKGLSAWTLKDTEKGYLPANHVELEEDAITALSVRTASGRVAFVKGADGWDVDGDPTLDAEPELVEKLVADVSRVRLGEVVGRQVLPEHGLTEGTVRVSWAVTEGEQTVPGGLVIGAEQGSDRFVKADGSPFVVLAPSYRLKSLVEADPAALTRPAAPDEGAPGEVAGE